MVYGLNGLWLPTSSKNTNIPSVKADLAIYTHVLGVPGQYESVALMLSHKMDLNCCANIGTVFAETVTYIYTVYTLELEIRIKV